MSENKNTKRNIGILAHIDAGKTTTTERILFYTGLKTNIGEVHEGDTTTDHLQQERERGITIISAAVTCHWKEHEITIIDTPGHIDFSGEVDRALRVLDSIVIVLCGVSGIEPQTKSVWMKSRKKNIPTILFINKMDREGANFDRIISNLEKTFSGTSFFPILLPIGNGREFGGMYDIVSQCAYWYTDFNSEHQFEVKTLEECLKLVYTEQSSIESEIEKIEFLRSTMLMQLNLDENASVETIREQIRRQTIENKIIPVVCGSSLKNKGVTQLLDSIVYYLASPEDLKTTSALIDNVPTELKLQTNEIFSSLVMKIVTDRFGTMSVIRVYSGAISKGDFVFNSVTQQREKISRIVRLHANKIFDINEAKAGDIVGLIGIKDALPGHTLTSQKNVVLEEIVFPEPVVSQAIIPKTKDDYDKLAVVLKKLALEDQTFSFNINQETNEMLIHGIGPLHLEVMINRMKDEYNLHLIVKTPEVRYRESIASVKPVVETYFLKKQTGGRGQFANVTLQIEKIESEFEFVNSLTGNEMERTYVKSVENGVRHVMENGVIAGYPMNGIKCTLLDGVSHSVDSSDLAFFLASQIAFSEAVLRSKPVILEPIAKVTIETPEEFISNIVADINSSKRGEIININENDNSKVIEALIPRANLFNFEGDLRSLSSGMACCISMENYNFKEVPKHLEDAIIEKRSALGKTFHSKKKNMQ